uniref:Securin n=1 Tax=Periophthalmus magnuspinnatus TaxID=409849 RepID=A0A3B4ATZ1_9GOBI
MSSILFEQENACLHPAGLRQRLQSAPGKLRTSAGAKNLHALQSGRKALGTVNKVPNHPQSTHNLHKRLKPQVGWVMLLIPNKYPDIEKFIPYDPLEFEKYSIPEDLLPLSRLALPGLTELPKAILPEESHVLIPLADMSPVKMPRPLDYCSEFNDFLHTLDELTVDLPPESDLD